jgi:Zn-finger nucleic acid-binding protein
MKCPHDGTELTAAKYEADIEVDRCGECKGMWLDYHELERIQDTCEKDYADEIRQLPNLVGNAYAMALARSKHGIECPQCGQAMERREHGCCSQVMIDVCPHCRGIWLDHGEIEALEVFFERTLAETRKVRSGFFARMTDLFG